jgi:hypothetical protein
MGLDITYCGSAEFVRADDPNDDNYDWEGGTEAKVYVNPDFAARADGLTSGIYRVSTTGGFRAGSYGGYNEWREELARLAGYPAVGSDVRHQHAQGAWDADGGPFHELINFSDCEGLIGPITSAKLAEDFAAFQDKVPADAGWFAEQYAHWRVAFDTAARGGFVHFH